MVKSLIFKRHGRSLAELAEQHVVSFSNIKGQFIDRKPVGKKFKLIINSVYKINKVAMMKRIDLSRQQTI